MTLPPREYPPDTPKACIQRPTKSSGTSLENVTISEPIIWKGSDHKYAGRRPSG